MEELRSAMEEHMELMADLVQKLSSELRSGIRPAFDNFMGAMVSVLTGIPCCLTDSNNLLQEEYELPDVSVPSDM
ncbi:hypothetical protein V6N11_065924 [Hibiscus sabdariffa]|uniref:Uncharacterized protein n=1 Tax=Hibiscus sabdariffa TaxID=183260 RepID=A0ABR2PIW5_9ROSI